MRKISLVIFANVMGCTQLYASTYCGKVEATYFDKVDGGPGVVYELLLKNDQKNKHLTLNVFYKNTKEEKLKKWQHAIDSMTKEEIDKLVLGVKKAIKLLNS